VRHRVDLEEATLDASVGVVELEEGIGEEAVLVSRGQDLEIAGGGRTRETRRSRSLSVGSRRTT
jgi:hypothetical protein